MMSLEQKQVKACIKCLRHNYVKNIKTVISLVLSEKNSYAKTGGEVASTV